MCEICSKLTLFSCFHCWLWTSKCQLWHWQVNTFTIQIPLYLLLVIVIVTRQVRKRYSSRNKFHTDVYKTWGTNKTSFYENRNTAKIKRTFTRGSLGTACVDIPARWYLWPMCLQGWWKIIKKVLLQLSKLKT